MKIFKNFFSALRIPAWAASAIACVCGASVADAQETASATELAAAGQPEKKESDYRNWFDVSVGGNIIKGDNANFLERHGLPADKVYGGVSDFHYEQDVGAKGLFEVDGRGIFD